MRNRDSSRRGQCAPAERGLSVFVEPNLKFVRLLTPVAAVILAAAIAAPTVRADPSFTTTGSMGEARFQHTATLLPNGKVLVAGGSVFGDPIASSELYDPGTGTWTAAGNLGTARGNHTATLLPNGKVLVVGGEVFGSPLASSEVYDPGTGTWTTTGSLATGRNLHTATLLSNGKVLVTGGFGGSSPFVSLNSSELYDPGTGTWTATGDLGTARQFHTATLLPNGKVLVVGGVGPGPTLASSELYDPGTGTWTATGSLGTARQSHTASLLPDGKVLVAGGAEPGFPFVLLASSELYDPGTGNWTATGDLGTAHDQHTATLLPSGKVLVAGGDNLLGLPSSELYDPGTGAWTATSDLGTARVGHTATLLASGKVLVAGGRDDVSGVLLASAELYDTMGAWTTSGDLSTAHLQHTATLLPSGKVIVAGGIDSSFNTLASSELYDPGTGAWTATGDLGTARDLHTATLLASGKVLVAGGASGFDPLASAELYDPGTGTWTATGDLGTARELHTATLLASGKVLVFGGSDGGSPLASSELYDPGTGTWSATGGPLDINNARRFHTATLLANGKVLVVGGVGFVNNGFPLASSEVYDPGTGTWTATGTLGTARQNHTATLLPNGKVLVAGGEGGTFPPVILASSELYDPDTGTWTATGSLSRVRIDHTATLLANGRVLVAGGTASSSELYDPGAGTWTATGSLSALRAFHTATLLASGEVLVEGGEGNSANDFPVSSEVYDEGLGYLDLWRPVLTSFSNPATHGTSVSASGIRFKGTSEASGGATNNSATNYPLVQLRRIDNEQTLFLPMNSPIGFSDTSFVSGAAWNTNPGPTLVTVFTNGIPSLSRYMTIEAPPLTVVASAGGPTTFCSGGSVILTAAPAGGSGTFIGYQWYNGASPIGGAIYSTYTAAVNGSYSVTVTDSTPTTSSNSNAIQITVNPLPTAFASGSATICPGGSTGLLGQGDTTGPYSCTWSPSTGLNNANTCTPVASPAVTTTYTLTSLSDGNGCVATNSPTVTVTAAGTIAVTGSTELCEDFLGAFAMATAPSTGTTFFQWGYRTVSGGAITDLPGHTGVSYMLQLTDFPGPGSYYLVCTLYVTATECNTQAGAQMLVSNEIQLHEDAGCGESLAPRVKFFTATTRNGAATNILQWVNPAVFLSGGQVRVRTDGTYPLSETDGSLVTTLTGEAEFPSAKVTFSHSSLTNGTSYSYALFTERGQPSGGRDISARPFNTPAGIKWVFSSGGITLATPGVRPLCCSPQVAGAIYANSNTRNIDAMNLGPAGGDWPTGWTPFAMNAPAPNRAVSNNLNSTLVGGSKHPVFAGSSDGRVYAVDGVTGALLWVSPVLGDYITAPPSTTFGEIHAGAPNLIMVGANSASGNKFYGLNITNGSILWTFTNGVANNIGVISGQALVDYNNTRVYFTSRAGGSGNSVWALNVSTNPPTLVWAAGSMGDIDADINLSGTTLYAGTTAGKVYALTTAGAQKWTGPWLTGGGPVKGLIWVSGTKLYFSTTSNVNAINDNGSLTTPTSVWTHSVSSPTTPLVYNNQVYVGGGDGKAYSINVTTASATTVTLGDPSTPFQVGSPTRDSTNNLLLFGSEPGHVYAVVPF